MISALRSFLPFARPYRRALLLGALLAILEVVVNLAEPWPLRIVVDHVLSDSGAASNLSHRHAVLALCAIGLLVIVGLAAVLDYWSSRLLSAAGLHLANDVRSSVFSHLQRLSMEFHGRQQVGDIAARVTSDVDRAQDMLIQTLAVIGPNVALMIGMFIVMLSIDVGFAVIALGLSPILVLSVHRSSLRLKQTSRRARKADGQVAAAATESLGVMELVQAFSLESDQRVSFDRMIRASLDAGLESARFQARFSPVVDVTGAVSVAVILWIGANRVLDGKLSLGVLLVFLSYLGSLYKPVKALSKLSISLAKGVAAAERVQSVLAESPRICDAPNSYRAPLLHGAITFDHVSFSYGREPVLQGVNIHIESGETFALVGPTGAGKSTLASLVPRLIDPTEGSVRLDGIDIRTYFLSSVRRQIAMVLQDCVLLRGSLRENILVGKPGATDDELDRAVRLALVDEFAHRLPMGLDTKVGERGASLSGGQRQRIAIARAILRDAPILILDEPTSALDATSEEILVAALSNLPAGRTTLLIAHRLSTVRNADRLAVLQQGRVAQLGVPSGLAAVDGPFRDLVIASGASNVLVEVHPTPPVAGPKFDADAGRRTDCSGLHSSRKRHIQSVDREVLP